jgi:large subunit ribosomal protein L32e
MVNPRKKPKFKRWMSQSLKRIKESWRRPRGIHSKIRRREKSKIKMPSVGYGAPKELKHLHPSGFKEVLVYNLNDLQKIDPKKEAARIAHTVGKKKRIELLKKAEELKIKVLNP